MSNLKSIFTIAAVSSVAFASPAFAGEKHKGDMKSSLLETKTAAAELAERPDAAMFIEPATEVMGAVERSEFIRVEGPDGRVYYNHLIPVSELPDPALELRVLDTVQVERDGAVFTNKIVQPLN